MDTKKTWLTNKVSKNNRFYRLEIKGSIFCSVDGWSLFDIEF